MSPKPTQGIVIGIDKGAWLMICERCRNLFRAYSKTRHYCSRPCYFGEPPSERFWKKVDKRGLDECWLWTASTMGGYPSFGYKGKNVRGSHMVWFLTHGVWPDKWVLHKCDTPLCVNPNHLFLGTALDNNHDMISKGRCNPPRGERAHFAKLTTKQVLEIRSKHAAGGVTQREIASQYSIGFKAINKIVLRQRWKHV